MQVMVVFFSAYIPPHPGTPRLANARRADGGRCAGRGRRRRGGWDVPGRARAWSGWRGRRGRGAGLAAVDLVEHRGEILRLRVLTVVDEYAAPAVDVDIELGDQALDRLELVPLGVDDERVGAALGDDERPPLPGRRRGRARRTGRGGGREGSGRRRRYARRNRPDAA